jgi:bacterioferritin (cytochrome b1)
MLANHKRKRTKENISKEYTALIDVNKKAQEAKSKHAEYVISKICFLEKPNFSSLRA